MSKKVIEEVAAVDRTWRIRNVQAYSNNDPYPLLKKEVLNKTAWGSKPLFEWDNGAASPNVYLDTQNPGPGDDLADEMKRQKRGTWPMYGAYWAGIPVSMSVIVAGQAVWFPNLWIQAYASGNMIISNWNFNSGLQVQQPGATLEVYGYIDGREGADQSRPALFSFTNSDGKDGAVYTTVKKLREFDFASPYDVSDEFNYAVARQMRETDFKFKPSLLLPGTEYYDKDFLVFMPPGSVGDLKCTTVKVVDSSLVSNPYRDYVSSALLSNTTPHVQTFRTSDFSHQFVETHTYQASWATKKSASASLKVAAKWSAKVKIADIEATTEKSIEVTGTAAFEETTTITDTFTSTDTKTFTVWGQSIALDPQQSAQVDLVWWRANLEGEADMLFPAPDVLPVSVTKFDTIGNNRYTVATKCNTEATAKALKMRTIQKQTLDKDGKPFEQIVLVGRFHFRSDVGCTATISAVPSGDSK